jgi:hypothetical protein
MQTEARAAATALEKLAKIQGLKELLRPSNFTVTRRFGHQLDGPAAKARHFARRRLT